MFGKFLTFWGLSEWLKPLKHRHCCYHSRVCQRIAFPVFFEARTERNSGIANTLHPRATVSASRRRVPVVWAKPMLGLSHNRVWYSEVAVKESLDQPYGAVELRLNLSTCIKFFTQGLLRSFCMKNEKLPLLVEWDSASL